MKNFVKSTLLITLLSLCLTACGFHLRGHTPLPAKLRHLYLLTNAPYSDFTKLLRTRLEAMHIHLVKTPSQAPMTLDILSEQPTQSVGGISASTNTRQYTLYFTVEFQLLDKRGHVLIPPQTVNSYRTLTINANQILASNSEASTFRREMQQEVIEKIFRHLAAREIRYRLR